MNFKISPMNFLIKLYQYKLKEQAKVSTVENIETTASENFEESYKIKLSNIFTQDEGILEEIKNFTGELLTYRTFTMFNFLGENGQGLIRYFLDKCSDVKYSVKLNSVLNFIFNNHQKEIADLEAKLKNLEEEYELLKENNSKYEFLKAEIDKNARILRLNIEYTGKNKNEIKKRIEQLKNLEEMPKKSKKKSLSELELMFNNINEQINLYEKSKKDEQDIKRENENRKILLDNLNSIIAQNGTLTYLVDCKNDIVIILNHQYSLSCFAKIIIS